MTAEQLVLDLPSRPALGRAAFFVAPANRLALALRIACGAKRLPRAFYDAVCPLEENVENLETDLEQERALWDAMSKRR